MLNTTVKNYLGLIRFSHTLFALPFALLAAAMALKLNWTATPAIALRLTDILGILLCMVFARSAAMGFNRWADRNPRKTHAPKTGIFHRASFQHAEHCFLSRSIPSPSSPPRCFFCPTRFR